MPTAPFRPRLWLFVLFLGVCIALPTVPEAAAEPASDDPPKLVVLVVFDQMRADYLTKWQDLFDKDGFGRLQRDGAWFQNAHYPYAFTLTAPGHASLSTGTTPSKHGIIANEWYDPVLRADVEVVKTSKYRTVPLSLDPKDKADGPAPIRLKQPTVGDSLLKAKEGKAKVVSLSIKDRAAILLAALRATAVYWFNNVRGLFCTSTYYRDGTHPWVTEFNKGRPVDKLFGKDWEKLRPDLDYAKYSGPDDVTTEGIGYGQGRTFPHPTTGGLKAPGKKFYEAFTTSPFASEFLLKLAQIAINAEKLGQRDSCDLLCLSFSTNDLIGHCWGPDSQEMLDITLRSDLIIKDLLNYLDAKVGKDRYVLVMTADHGVGPLTELAAAQGKDAGRVPPTLFTTEASAFLQKRFAKDKKQLPWVEKFVSEYIYLNHGTIKELNLEPAKVEQALTDWLRKQPGIQAAYGRTALEKGDFNKDPIGQAMKLSFHPESSGDVAIITKPYWIVSGAITDPKYNAYRTTHGTPHPYDTHVPLLVYGNGVVPGVRKERVVPLATAAILARALDVPLPGGSEYPVPDGLFKK
jgi:predicted AlkP superfamily pyrophosphatase or phosphodiesterase